MNSAICTIVTAALSASGTGMPGAAAAVPHSPATHAWPGQASTGSASGDQGQEEGQLAARPALSDELIVAAVEDELLADPKIDLNWITVFSTNGVVQLDGRARDLLSRQRATRLARTVRGVQRVDNTITVPVSEKSESELAADVESALLLNVATDSYEIQVRAEPEGRIVLAGMVGSDRERELAERVAASVRGVTRIDNRLELDLDEIRTDPELRAEIREALEWNVRVDHRPLNVSVSDGVVSLRGTVASAAEFERVERLAWVVGVRDVDMSRVRILDAATAWSYGPGDMEPWTDEDIAGAVQRMLRYDPLIDTEGVTADVEDGTATLRGTVTSLQAKVAATAAANDVVGVERVRNRLRIRPDRDVTDDQVADRIRQAVQLDPWLDAEEIRITVDDGVVTLRGEVEDAFSRADATATAAAVNGVTRVINRLEAEAGSTVFLYDPWVDWWPNESLILTPTTSPVVDSAFERELEADIESQMWWSPFVDSDDVVVTVNGTTATLTGLVDSTSERDAAIENAYEGGAVVVIDQLVVDEDDS